MGEQRAGRAVLRQTYQLLLLVSGLILIAGCQLASTPEPQTREPLLSPEALPTSSPEPQTREPLLSPEALPTSTPEPQTREPLLSPEALPASSPEPHTRELLLPSEALPATWEISGAPQPMGSSIGLGDKDDSYVSFRLKSDKSIISSHFVLHYPTGQQAEREYPELSRSNFNDNSIVVTEPWHTPAELSYVSPYADLHRAACTIFKTADQRLVCRAMSKYGPYVVIFQSVIRPDTLSLAEFNDLVEYLDEMTARKLGLDLG